MTGEGAMVFLDHSSVSTGLVTSKIEALESFWLVLPGSPCPGLIAKTDLLRECD